MRPMLAKPAPSSVAESILSLCQGDRCMTSNAMLRYGLAGRMLAIVAWGRGITTRHHLGCDVYRVVISMSEEASWCPALGANHGHRRRQASLSAAALSVPRRAMVAHRYQKVHHAPSLSPAPKSSFGQPARKSWPQQEVIGLIVQPTPDYKGHIAAEYENLLGKD